jgi:5-methylcytosine-specific restriction protein A
MPTLRRRKDETPIIRNDPYRHIYQSARWHKFSKQFLKENRLCKECLDKGITEVAQVTDHVIPLKMWIPQGGDPFDLNNVQPLSKVCHNRKTARENKGWNKQ